MTRTTVRYGRTAVLRRPKKVTTQFSPVRVLFLPFTLFCLKRRRKVVIKGRRR